MAVYQIRNLHCIPCDRPVRARNEIIDGVEQAGHCPTCGTELSAIDLDFDQVVESEQRPPATIVFTVEAAREYICHLVDAFDEEYDGDLELVAGALVNRVPEVVRAFATPHMLHIRFTPDFPIRGIGMHRAHGG